MDQLPFSRREPRIREIPQSSPHLTFDQVNYHTPLNKQTVSSRQSQEGNLRPLQMKINCPIIDCRTDQLERNRVNMFNGGKDVDPSTITFASSSIKPNTRHQNTPYSYSTSWISHPDPNTSLSPLKSEAYLTSFLQSPNAKQDKIKQANFRQNKYEYLRKNESQFQKYVSEVDTDTKARDQNHIRFIQQQRNNHLEALENRRRVEKVRFFE